MIPAVTRWIAAAGAGVISLDSIINVAFPAMAAAFAEPPERVRWVIVCYVFTYALTAFSGGALADRVGHARVFRVGLLLTAVALTLGALAPTFGLLLGAREGHAARDRRSPLPVFRRGLGREGQDRRGTARALRRPESREIPRARYEEGPGLMPITLDRAVVGKAFPPYAVTVERGKIKEFARAVGDLNPFYLDDRVGAASEWGDIIAPPTFATTLRDDSLDYTAFLRQLGTDISRVLHGEQEFELHQPLQPGRTYLCRAKVVDIYEKTGKSGPMGFVVRETTDTDADNEIVGTMRAVTVVRL